MRLFIAIEIPSEIREKIYRDLEPLRQAFPKIKWIPSQNLHLTLKFLGEVQEEKIKVIQEKMTNIASFKPFPIEFLGLGGFPNLNRPKVIWLGINQGQQELSKLVSYLETELDKIGFPRENHFFQAHLTLARLKHFKGDRGFQEKVLAFKTSFASFSVNMVSLMQSSLTREGAVYNRVCHFHLGGI